MLRATGNMTSASKVYTLATAGNTKTAIAVLDSVAIKVPKKELELKKAANYLKSNNAGLVDYRRHIPDANEEMRGLGAIESNIDKILASISESLEADSAAWLASRMPAFIGPHQGRPWVKVLRNISRYTTAEMRL